LILCLEVEEAVLGQQLPCPLVLSLSYTHELGACRQLALQHHHRPASFAFTVPQLLVSKIDCSSIFGGGLAHQAKWLPGASHT